jgi:hypothetical protein
VRGTAGSIITTLLTKMGATAWPKILVGLVECLDRADNVHCVEVSISMQCSTSHT